MPGLRAGRQPPGPAALSGAPPARERRQHLVRQPHPRRERAARDAGRGPGGAAGAPRAQARIPGSRCPPTCTGPSGATPAASICAIPRRWTRLAEQLDRRLRARFRRRGPASRAARGEARAVLDPADRSRADRQRDRGRRRRRSTQAVRRGAGAASPAGTARRSTSAPHCLRRAADLYEANAAELLAWCVREAGKTLPDAVAEVREAVDFLRYYARRRATAGRAARAARADRREQPARPARPRRVRRDQPVELPARDLHRPDRGRAGGRQCGARQAGGADAADRRQGGRPAASGRRARGCADPAARRAGGRRAAGRPTRASPASRSPARPRPPGRSTARSPPRTARSCR